MIIRKTRVLFFWLLVTSPAWLMLSLIIRGSETQFGDYFNMIGQLFHNGAFVPLGFLEHQNEHLVAIPKLIYLINIWLFEGSNISLGVFVWCSALASALILLLLVEAYHPKETLQKYLLRFAAFLLVFPVAAIHNFVYSMSGTSWILSNLFSLLAIYLASRDKIISGAIFAVAATFSYGTGLAAWPALFLVLLLKRNWGIPQFAALALGAASILIERVTSSTLTNPNLASDPFEILRQVLINSGSLLSNDVELALVFGVGIVSVFATAFLKSVESRKPDWQELATFGLGAFALTSIILFSISRLFFGESIAPSRYMTVIGLLTFAALISVSVFSKLAKVQFAASLTISLLALASSVPSLHGYDQKVAQLDLNAVEMRMGSAEGRVFWYERGTSETLSRLSHFPFNETGDALFCGLLSKEISVARDFDVDEIRGNFDGLEEPFDGPSILYGFGWLYPTNAECLLIVDKHSRVVGAAVPGFKRMDASKALNVAQENLGWRAVIFSGSVAPLSLVVKLPGNEAFLLVDELN